MDDLQAFGLIGELLAVRRGVRSHVRLRRRRASAVLDWPKLLVLASEQLVTPALAAAVLRLHLLGKGNEELGRYFEGVFGFQSETQPANRWSGPRDFGRFEPARHRAYRAGGDRPSVDGAVSRPW